MQIVNSFSIIKHVYHNRHHLHPFLHIQLNKNSRQLYIYGMASVTLSISTTI